MHGLNKHESQHVEKERTIRTLFAAIVFYSDFNLVNRYVCSHVKGRRWIHRVVSGMANTFSVPLELLALIAVPGLDCFAGKKKWNKLLSFATLFFSFSQPLIRHSCSISFRYGAHTLVNVRRAFQRKDLQIYHMLYVNEKTWDTVTYS